MPVERDHAPSPRPVPSDVALHGAKTPLTLALALQHARRRRRSAFPHADAIFHEPAWDMLIDLFVAELQGGAPVFEDLCAGANVRAPTGLRWITTLEQLGLVRATATPGAGLPVLSLTDGGREAMLAYLAGF